MRNETIRSDVEEEIEMLTITANPLLMLHNQQGFKFVDNEIFTEDILHLVFTNQLYKARFKMICADTIDLRVKGWSDDEIIEYFLINLEEITLCADYSKETPLPSPSIH